jgi:hypothetical protein
MLLSFAESWLLAYPRRYRNLSLYSHRQPVIKAVSHFYETKKRELSNKYAFPSSSPCPPPARRVPIRVPVRRGRLLSISISIGLARIDLILIDDSGRAESRHNERSLQRNAVIITN